MKNDLDLKKLLSAHGLDTVDGAFSFNDGTDMTIAGLGHRQRWTLKLADEDGMQHVLFMKRYGAEPLKWVLQRWCTYGIGGSPASVENDCIEALHETGIETIPHSFAAHEMRGLFAKRSYIVLSKVPGQALEQSLEPFIAKHGVKSEAVEEFSRKLADLVSNFHAAGFVHRDLYTSHVFMDEGEQGVSLCLIDLARMFRPRARKFRWLIKDISQLKFSMPKDWLAEYWNGFMDAYCVRLGMGDSKRRRLEKAVDAKVLKIVGHDAKKRARRQNQLQGAGS